MQHVVIAINTQNTCSYVNKKLYYSLYIIIANYKSHEVICSLSFHEHCTC